MRIFPFLFFGFCFGYHAQNVLWIDTLRYSSCTYVGLMFPNGERNIVAFGSHNEGYSVSDFSKRRDFMFNLESNGNKKFLDSSSTGGSLSIVSGNAIYKCLWLTSLNNYIPMISSTIYPEGIYLVKFDLTGKVIWTKKQPFHAIPNQMTVDRNGLIYIQYTNGNGGLFCKYNSDGEMLPCQFPPGLNPRFDADNNLFLTGYDSKLRKLDYSGNLLWSNDASNDAHLEVDEIGNSFILYGGIQAYDPDGKLLWTNPTTDTYNGKIRVEGENLYFVYTTGPSHLSSNFVSKLDAKSGGVIWTTPVSVPSWGLFRPNAITSNSGIVYYSASEPDPGVSSTILVAIEDLSYIPVTTSLPSAQKKTGALQIAPNPSNGTVRVCYSFEEGTGSEVRVLDALGREVYRKPINGFAGSTEQILDLSHLLPGVYLLEINSSGWASDAKRLVIQ